MTTANVSFPLSTLCDDYNNCDWLLPTKNTKKVLVEYREEMDYFANHCYWFIRLILRSAGLWPYTDRRTRSIVSCIHILGEATFMFCMLLKFIILFPSIDSIIYILGYLAITLTAFLSHFTLINKMSKIKILWEYIERDWKKLEKTNTISIMEQYACKSNLLSLYVIILISIYYIFTYLDVFLPYMLDAIAPLKWPLRQKIIIPVVLFEKYDVPLTLISSFLLMQVGILMATYISEFIICVHHACLLFSLVGDILERGFTNIEEKNYATNKDNILYEAIVESVKYHGTAIRFSKVLEDVYNFACFYVMIAVIALLSSNTLRLFHMALAQNLFSTIASFIFLCSTVGIAFIVTHIGQLLIDHSLDVFDKTCAVPWYMASLKTQKLLLLILTRGLKASCITHGKMTILAHTLFTTLLHTAISFTTVFISMR